MRHIVTDGVALCVCLSVCRSVCGYREPSKNGWTDRDIVWGVDSGGPKEPCITYRVRIPMRRGNFEGGRSARQMAVWKSKINNSSTTDFELWRNDGPSAFQLQETMLKSDKIWCTYFVINCVSLRAFWTSPVRRQGLHSSANTLTYTVPPTLPNLESAYGRSQLQFRLHGTPYNLTFSTLQTLLLSVISRVKTHLLNLDFNIFIFIRYNGSESTHYKKTQQTKQRYVYVCQWIFHTFLPITH